MSLNLDNLTPEEKEFKKAVESAGIPTTEDGLKIEFQLIADETELKITNTSVMSPFWNLIKVIATKPVYWMICFLIRYVMPNNYVKTAKGWFLDLIAFAYDLKRQEAKKTVGNLTFRRTAVSSPLTIPAGTKVRTVAINNVVYRLITIEDISFEAGKDTVLIEAIAEKAGIAYNLAVGYYSILESEIPGVTAVSNETNWLLVPGDDKENDEDFRLSIQNQFSSVGDWHIDSKYKSMITKITGLSSNRIYFDHNIPRGPGSADAYILFDAYTPSPPYIEAINRYIRDEGNHGHGDDILAKVLPEKKFDIDVTVYFLASFALEKHNETLIGIEQFIRCAFRENSAYLKLVTQTYPWSRFAFSKLDQEIHDNFPGIASLNYSLTDIVSEFWIARLGTLRIIEGRDAKSCVSTVCQT